ERVEIDVGQQRRENAALRAALLGVLVDPFRQVARFQPAVDEPQHLSVADASPKRRHQLLVVQPVEETLDVRIYPPTVALRSLPLHLLQGVMRADSRTEAEGRRSLEVRLEDRLQQQLRGCLDDAV